MKNNISSIKKSIYLLQKNECIGVPTETVYGLAANAYSDTATSRIFKLKKRPKKNPLIVHYYDMKDLKNDCYINKNLKKLYDKLCPGPITFVLKLKKKSKISKNVTNNKKTLAVRFPKHFLFRKLLKKLQFPLAAPSANISTGISPVTKQDVYEEFGNKIKFILDGGRAKIGLESTILDLSKNPRILRLGGLEIKKINKLLKMKLKYSIKLNNNIPGQSTLHYSPGIPIELDILEPKKNSAYILFKKRKNKNKNYFYLTKNNNMKEAGKNLYKTLRIIKKRKYKFISVEKFLYNGIGKVIKERLVKASKK